MSRGSGMRITPRPPKSRPPALSEAERAAMKKNYYRQLESWLSEPADTGWPELPKALMRPTKKKKKR
ncbi:Uncharacterised protein [Mycolicibacterium fortuitum]|uniref:Uncharacterized protein n=1 Tax=Mycolicibacterium fortuitum TaxID=1766 RepID=A0A378V2M1_MYCFO|nr:Uncharacterised protein [Mycolicibacterium fortuitum]